MTKQELFEWAAQNGRKFPELGLLRETIVDGAAFINLPVQYGIYAEQYKCESRVKIESKQRGERR